MLRQRYNFSQFRKTIVKYFSLLPILIASNSIFAEKGLIQLLETSVENYPGIHAKQFEYFASRKEIDFQKSDFNPKADLFLQGGAGTVNNITGMFQPGYVQPISGPPSSENIYRPVLGSAGGLLMKWSPFTFGKRESKIDLAKLESEVSLSERELYIFEHKIRFIKTYLDYWYSNALILAMEKNLQRNESNLKVSKAMVASGIRPGVDAAQFQSLYSRTKIELLKAKQNKQKQSELIIELLGTDTQKIEIDASLSRNITVNFQESLGNHPLLEKIILQKKVDLARKVALGMELSPNLEFWGTGYARGSGADQNGNMNYGAEGLAFSRYNYGFGFHISIPLLKHTELRHKMSKQELQISATEKYKQMVERQLTQEYNTSVETLKNSLESVKLSPDYVKSAEFAYKALQSRYESGLINFTELVQGQYELAKAEAEDVHIRAEMFHALLYYSAVQGNLEIFLEHFRKGNK